MNHRQNPFHFSQSVGAGLNNISRGIYGYGRLGLYGARRGGRARTQSQMDLDYAQTSKAQAETRKIDFEGDALRTANATRTPTALNEYGADTAGLSQLIYNNLKSEPVTGAHPPLASAGYSVGQRDAAREGRIAESMFAANENPNPLTFSQARTEGQDRSDLQRVIAGTLDRDVYAGAKAAGLGKPTYSVSGGTKLHQYSGKTETTPVGFQEIQANIDVGNKNKSLAEKYEQDILQSQAEVKKIETQTESGGYAPAAPKAFSKIDKETNFQFDAAIARQVLKKITAADSAADLSAIDPATLTLIKGRATGFYIDPKSSTHNNIDASVAKAIKSRDPRGKGFEDTKDWAWGESFEFKDRSQPAPKSGKDAEYDRLRKELYPNG